MAIRFRSKETHGPPLVIDPAVTRLLEDTKRRLGGRYESMDSSRENSTG